MATFGTEFFEYVNKWKNTHGLLISQIAKTSIVDPELEVLYIYSNYNTKVGRGKKTMIQIEYAEVGSMLELDCTMPNFRATFEPLKKTVRPSPEVSFLLRLLLYYTSIYIHTFIHTYIRMYTVSLLSRHKYDTKPRYA